MRKIPREYENGIDNVLLDWTEMMRPTLIRMNATPNQVTMVSILFEIGAVWALWAGKPIVFAVSYLLGVVADFADGDLARSTNQVSKLGDWLDHTSDNLHALGILGVVAYRVGWPGALVPLGIVALFGLLQSVHLGCQQKYYERVKRADSEPETLDSLKGLCAGPEESWMKWTKWVGVGTFQLVMGLVAAYYVFFRHRRQ